MRRRTKLEPVALSFTLLESFSWAEVPDFDFPPEQPTMAKKAVKPNTQKRAERILKTHWGR
jgi:hypothetical protein